ncbi:MAG TPA: hypothetical protein VFG07_10670 [Thermoplasmata archaeon]|nr:hypothetical protein [Thermoplasmata archaeon]
MDPTQIIQGILFAIFAGLTALLSFITGPTYDNLLVPELQPGALFPAVGPTGGGGFLGEATVFSNYLLAGLVDPAIGLVAVGVAGLYLTRAMVGRWALRFDAALPKLVVAVILANFSVPVAGGVLSVAGAAYPVVAGFDGGAWQHWTNLAGVGGIQFSWDNGVLTFVVSFALFSVVLLLAVAIALRDALLAVLLVLLPVMTLLWPLPSLAPLARRAWAMFAQLAFLPCVLVIPLELAVGSPSVLLLLGFLVTALSSPSLLSMASAHLGSVGFPSGGSALSGGIQRGLSVGSLSLSGVFRPLEGASGKPGATRHVAHLGQLAGRAAFPAGAPLVGAELLGRGAGHLLKHVARHLPDRLRHPRGFPGVVRPKGREPP